MLELIESDVAGCAVERIEVLSEGSTHLLIADAVQVKGLTTVARGMATGKYLSHHDPLNG